MNQQHSNDDWSNANQRNKQGFGARVDEEICPQIKDVYVRPMSVGKNERIPESGAVGKRERKNKKRQ